MSEIPRKIQGKSGTSMLLAMVYLLFCVLAGGTALAAAAAHRGRAEIRQRAQQQQISRRCAMGLLTEQLRCEQENPLSLTIKDVTVTDSGDTKRTITFTLQGEPEDKFSLLQQLLAEYAASRYLEGIGSGVQYKGKCEGFSLPGSGQAEASGSLTITAKVHREEILQAVYTFTDDCGLTIHFQKEDGTEDLSSLCLTVNAYSGKEETVTVTVDGVTTKTQTSILCWEDAVIDKGGEQP